MASLTSALALVLFVGTGSASATPAIFAGQTVNPSGLPCTTQGDGVRVCHGQEATSHDLMGTNDTRLKSFDGVPLEVFVTLPPGAGSGPYPLVMQAHGWDSQPSAPNDTQYYGPTADTWAKDGYAVLQLTDRGWFDSCGTSASRTDDPLETEVCTSQGYIRLDDDRYEIRDYQYAAGLLVDEGLVNPSQIGVTGESYGGGVSMALASLKDRVMNSDGTTSPWKSPKGTPLSLAASAPVIPWSDLVYSLLPNGRTLDYQTTPPTADLSPLGVEKQSFVTGLYALGQKDGYYAPSGTDEQADLTSWYAAINAGEPYDGNSEDQSIAAQIAQYHSAYYLLDGTYGIKKESPAPLLIGNGFTDDLFPVDEALRYYNLEHSLYPSDPISLVDGDFGHQPSNNKSADIALLSSHIKSFFDHYVKGTGAQPTLGFTAFTETCPKTTPSGGPYTASTWSGLHPGEVDYTGKGAQTVSSSAGNPTISTDVDPVASSEAGQGACTTVSATDQGSGVATYRLPTVTGSGYTLLGSPTVIADINVTGNFSYIAARLWDVDTKTNTETLVSRGDYRIDSGKPDGLQVFQLHPGAWHFAAGHVPKLELLGQDVPYLRASNGQFSISVSNLQLRLPVHEKPSSPPPVTKPKPPVHPKPKPAPGCPASPHSAIAQSKTKWSRKGLGVSGTAGETACPTDSAKARKNEKVVHVYVMIYQGAGNGRCRFLQSNGKLSSPRSCGNPIEFRAKGTSKWSLSLKIKIPPGSYVIRSDAIDGLGHHQHWSNAARQQIRVH